MRRLDTADAGFEPALAALLAARAGSAARVDAPVAAILDDLRRRGDPAQCD